MAILGSATYKLHSDNTALNRGLARAEQSSRQSAKRISANFAKVGVASLAMGAGLGAGLFKLVKAASSAQEATNAVNVEFEEGAHIIHKFAKTSAEEVGLSSAAFMQTASQVGALFRNYGLSAKEAAEQTKVLTIRAADLASVADTTVKEALNAMSSALRGETEPIRRFSVDVTDASIQMYLLSQGIDKSVTSMSQAEKGMLRYAAMMEQSKRKAGDFAATSRDAANSSKILDAQVQNTSAMMGQGLLPVLEPVLMWLRANVKQFQLWAENNPKWMRAIVIAIAAIAVLAFGLGSLLLVASALLLVFAGLGAATLLAFGHFALIALAIAALVAGIVWLILNWDKVVAAFKALPLWAKIAAAAIALLLLPAFIRLAAMLALTLLRFVAFTVGWLLRQVIWAVGTTLVFAIWIAWTLAKFVLWSVLTLARFALWAVGTAAVFALWVALTLAKFALWSVTSLARFALWAVGTAAVFALWVALSLAKFALWSVTSLATFAAWIATTLARFMTWALLMVVRWLIALGPVGLLILGIALLGAAAYLLIAHWESIDARWRKLWDGLKAKAIDVLNAIIDKINLLIRLWNSIPVVPGLGDIGKVDAGGVNLGRSGLPLGLGTWKVPGFAEGGIVTGPTFARLGEEGTEVVLPLSKLGKGLGGGLTIIFQGDVYGFEDFQDRVRDTVDEEVRRGVEFGAP